MHFRGFGVPGLCRGPGGCNFSLRTNSGWKALSKLSTPCPYDFPVNKSKMVVTRVGGRFGYFLFFLLGGVRGAGRGGGGGFLLKIPGGGVLPGRVVGRVFVGNLGGGAKYFFSGPKFPPSRVMLGQGCLRALFWGTIYFHLKWV